MLNAQLQLARRLKLDETIKLGDRDVSIVSESGELDLSLVESRKNGLLDMSAEEEQLQIREEKVGVASFIPSIFICMEVESRGISNRTV